MPRPRATLAFGAGVFASLLWGAQAVPSVNVALETSFGAPPFLIELLETAAEENATAYFPLLDRIADGHFDTASTDRELYEQFRLLLQKDGHLGDEDLSSFDYAVSIHSTAPRIEAHFQYYNTSIAPSLSGSSGDDCISWVHVPFSGQRYCSPDLEASTAQAFGAAGESLPQLPFDRVLGDALSGRPSVLYADITSRTFRQFHKTLSKTAREGKTSYQVRYKSPAHATYQPLTANGYGVELALKRTDYIVIDDRQAEEEQKAGTGRAGEAKLSEEEVLDLRPLSQSELLRLGTKAASFVMKSDSPFETLLRLTQDFPKHSSSIAATNISDEFMQEHVANRDTLLPAGFNVLWINGVQIMPRDVDAYSLLEHLRRERKMINSVREVGLSGAEAIELLSHEAITASQVDQDTQRYDWRDDIEGGDVIVWMNDIEKDKRYQGWPDTIVGLLQRTYPGQLPSVRRDIHNVVIPIDFANPAHVAMVVETIQSFIKRKVPIRFGLVPHSKASASAAQAKVIYYLVHRYGLSAALDYLSESLEGAGRKYGTPQQQYFDKATADRTLRRDKDALDFEAITSDGELDGRLKAAQAYYIRLGAGSDGPPILVNGFPVPASEEWLQHMSQRISMDGRQVQQSVFDGKLTEDSYIPELFLSQASIRRNPIVVPEDDKETRHVNLGSFPELSDLPTVPSSQDTIERELVHLTVAADLDSKEGLEQLMEALLFQKEHDNVELAALHIPRAGSGTKRLASSFDVASGDVFMTKLLDRYNTLRVAEGSAPVEEEISFSKRQAVYDSLYAAASVEPTPQMDQRARTYWTAFAGLGSAIGVAPGQKAIVINGRVVGPVDESVVIEKDDLEAAFGYERKKRLLPAALAIQALKLEDKSTSPLAFARISNLIALSTVSDVPEGIFEAAPTVRTGVFKNFSSSATAIHVGDEKTATIQIYASVDPSSEIGQRWIPIIKVLSELNGVYTRLFLNPRDRLDELPIKRFYRTVLSARPTFADDGSLLALRAHFAGLPADALLNMGMDVPPSWLVAPQNTVHDLDNIKLSAIKSGADIDAIYGLEHILIEGHSRGTASGPPPAGVQLVLQTEHEPHFADTIIMANLGYFQFKANPGVYNLVLQEGRSTEIFSIDSAGTMGYNEMPGDNVTDIALMSFRGATLFPRLSRKAGMEDEDVLEPSKSTLESLAGSADKLLAQAGLKIPEAGKYLSQAAKFGSGLFGSGKAGDVAAQRHADINIFSVASGHLYERMLNIMMVSVMKHTKHTVKFWFIEQFLSPSFKDFLPVMAQEYGFQYEMVTYKWPHWLRGQKEKQREIWGYKILFLDVLFPLDLDKVIFVDADQIVRTDMHELVQLDLQGAPYGFTPMCDSRVEMEGFRFWKQGYWKSFLKGLPYHISALYVVDLKKFRQIAAGDRLRQTYHQLSADPNSLSNLDQDLPNNMQQLLPIHSLPQEWLWCETWCSDESLKDAKTIDLCNNPQTKEPKLDRARRQVPEWTVYDNEIAAVAKRYKESQGAAAPQGGRLGSDAAAAGGVPDVQGSDEGESIQERLQREDAERERRKSEKPVRDEL